MRQVVRTLAALAVVIGLAAGPAAAMKAKPLFTDKFNETFEDPEFAAFLSAVCQVPQVTVTVTEKGKVDVFEDGARGHVNVRVVVRNTETGQYAVQSVANSFTNSAVETVDGDLLQVEITDTNTGLPIKWQAPGVGVIVRDAGRIGFSTVLLIDLATGELIEEENAVDFVNGPHPWADQGFGPTPEQAAAICGAIGGSPA